MTETDSLREERVRRLVALWEEEEAAGAALRDLPAPEPAQGVDLATLLDEMTALKAELRAETRAARDQRAALGDAQELLVDQLQAAREHEAALRRELEECRRARKRDAAQLVVAIQDRLEPALRQARRLAEPKRCWFVRRSDPAAQSLARGLEMTLGRLAEQMQEAGVRRIDAAGVDFDPACMEAVEVVCEPALDDARVVEVVTPGYAGPAGLLRPAQVVVNRSEGRGAATTREEA